MDDLFVMNPGGGDEEGQATREADWLELRDLYVHHLVDIAGIDEQVADRVIAALFDHTGRDGKRCQCGCHPRLGSLHGSGFDCPCTWDDERRAREAAGWIELRDRPWAVAMRERHATEEEAIARWLSGQRGVEARRVTSFAPEQWKGSVDGHSFYFRERHGTWRLELDLQPSGRFADRLVEVREDGELVTEPVPIMKGEVIAEGVDTQLGDDPVEHITLIVSTIRDHLWSRGCDHDGALFFCPKCGKRISGPTAVGRGSEDEGA